MDWRFFQKPSAKMLSELNKEADFTAYAREIKSLEESGDWEWKGCRWRNKLYQYGTMVDSTPIPEEDRDVLLDDEQKELLRFWNQFSSKPKDLLKAAEGTKLPKYIYHPKVALPTVQEDKLLELMGAVITNRVKMQKVQGSVTLMHDWSEEMNRLGVEQKATHNFLRLEKKNG